MKPKIAILVSGVGNRGGVERIALLQAQHFNADIYTGRYDPKTTFPEFQDIKVTELYKGKLPRRIASFLIRFKFKKLKLKGYDFFIFHGGHSLAAAKNHKPNMWYCHAPTRWLYDLYEDEVRKFKPLKRTIFKIIAYILKKDDQKNVKHINKIITNSENVKDRVRRFYNRNATVIYPFVNLDKFKFREFGDFYLSSGRVDPIKRTTLLVQAFQKMPNKKLVVASGGPDLDKVKKMAEGYPNIEVLGWVSDKKLAQLYADCLATVYVSYREDFGMVPPESMSCGKPCIGSNDGGMKETIIHEKTGLLIDVNIENIIKAVNWLTKEKAMKMKEACIERAKKFSEEIHIKQTEDEVKKSLN